MKLPKTKSRRAIERRRKNVIKLFTELTRDNPDASEYAKCMFIADRMNLTREGVRKIIKASEE